MIIRIFASDDLMREQLLVLVQKALDYEKIDGEVLIVTPEQNKDIYKLEIDPTIVIDEQLVIEEFIPTIEELGQVIRMQEEGKYENNHECCGWWWCGSDREKDDSCCGWSSCSSSCD